MKAGRGNRNHQEPNKERDNNPKPMVLGGGRRAVLVDNGASDKPKRALHIPPKTISLTPTLSEGWTYIDRLKGGGQHV